MKVLIGYDGSESADAIFTDLKRAGLPPETQALVVSVGNTLMSSPPVREAAGLLVSTGGAAAVRKAQTNADRIIKEAEEFASKAAARLRSEFPGWAVERRVIKGTPAWELIEAANDW